MMSLSDFEVSELVAEIESRGFCVQINRVRSDEEIQAAIAHWNFVRRVIVRHRHETPSGIVNSILRRLSRDKILTDKEFDRALWACCKKHSGSPANTAKACGSERAWGKWFGYYKGHFLSGPDQSYSELAREAMREKRQFVNIETYRRKKLERDEYLCNVNTALINLIKKEIKNVSKNRNGGTTASVLGKYDDGREVGRYKGSRGFANAEAGGAD